MTFFPSSILLFSGKRKSGKDYITDKLQQKIGSDSSIIIKISAPIKSHFSKTNNLDLHDLMSDGDYKEKYRKEMIIWSDSMRDKDPGVFCRSAIELYNAKSKPVWIVSDVRRKTDIKWFKESYSNVATIRLETDDHIRKERGWVFTPGVDDVASECDLDDYTDWNWRFTNNGDEKIVEDIMNTLISYLNIGR